MAIVTGLHWHRAQVTAEWLEKRSAGLRLDLGRHHLTAGPLPTPG